MKKTAIVIDGNSLVYRMYYATYKLAEYAIAHNYQPVNAVKLMIDTVCKLLANHYDYGLIAFDHGKKTLRHEVYSDYKAGRKPMPEPLVSQLPIIKQALIDLGFVVMSKEGIEADDLIGSFTYLMNENQITTDVYSSDRDMLQLVDEYINVSLLKTGIKDLEIHTLANFGQLNNDLVPKQIIDYKAIIGDSSDHLIGVNGIGPKTGIKLIHKYQSVDNLYHHLDELNEAQKHKFLDAREKVFLNYQLATIDQSLFVDENPVFFQLKPINHRAIKKLLRQYHIHGLDKYFNDEEEQLEQLSLGV